MHVSLNKKQKIVIVAIIITMSIIAVLLSKLINHEEPKTVTKTPEVTDSQDLPPKETSIPKLTKQKEITKLHESQKSFSDYVESYISSNAKIKEIELEVGEPIREIKSEEDIFETWVKEIMPYSTVRIYDDNTTKWGIGHVSYIISDEITRHYNEGFNIEGMNKVLKDKGFSISDCDIKFISDGYYSDGDDLVFRIFDSNNEALFLLKDKKLIDLSDYGITFFYNHVYSVKENNINYIGMLNKENNTMENYIIPFELKSVESAYVLSDNQNDVYIVANKVGKDNPSYFKINNNDKTIVEFNTIKKITDFFPYKFSFKSEIYYGYNTIIKESDDLYVIFGSDGRNDFTCLYCINKHTGKRIWYYDEYCDFEYMFTDNEKYILVYSLFKGGVKFIEIDTGRFIQKGDQNHEANYKYNLECSNIHEMENAYIVENCNEIFAVDKDSLEIIWDLEIPYDSNNDFLIEYRFDNECLYYIHSNDYILKCIDINTGTILWKKEMDSFLNSDFDLENSMVMNDLFIFISDREILAVKNDSQYAIWESTPMKEFEEQFEGNSIIDTAVSEEILLLIYNDGLVAVDINNGNILWNTQTSTVRDWSNIKREKYGENELLILINSDKLYVINTLSGNINCELNKEGIKVFQVKLEENIMHIPFDDYVLYMDIRTGEGVEKTIEKKDYGEYHWANTIIEEISGNSYYDGITIENVRIKNSVRAKNITGKTIWEFKNYSSFNSLNEKYPSPVRIKNNVFIKFEDAVVCIDALTGNRLYQISVNFNFFTEVVKQEEGIFWFIGNNGYIDVYKID